MPIGGAPGGLGGPGAGAANRRDGGPRGGQDNKDKKKKEGFLPNRAAELAGAEEKAIERARVEANGRAPDKLPPGLNPLKYTANPTPSYEGTAKNIGTLVGGIITGRYTSPLGMIGELIGSDEVTGLTREIGDVLGIGGAFENPTAPTTSGDYDKSEPYKATPMGGNGSTMKKRPKTPKPGFTLLKGVGGTLVGT